ncbi:hypothetical protein [Halomarina litorea]|uniref:hypothetical protein n=1 Tax=Halomarina litorea TaxID=2961595 RepID=UPI0020C4E3C6|nr:hypothetical protein [Halomarina sp. BCD28]
MTNEMEATSGHHLAGGFSLAADGLRLVPDNTIFESGVPVEWTFHILGGDGRPITEFEESHGERSHLIVVRRDLTAFQHLHPTLEADGTWRVAEFSLPAGGVYRAFVDVVVDDRPTTLGIDLLVSGTFEPNTDQKAMRRATAADYDIELQSGLISVGEASQLSFVVRREDGTSASLHPYLGALGHLVTLRDGDLAYLHVHPVETNPEDGTVAFDAQFPTPGHYRLFLQAKPDGELVTAAFDIQVEG